MRRIGLFLLLALFLTGALLTGCSGQNASDPEVTVVPEKKDRKPVRPAPKPKPRPDNRKPQDRGLTNQEKYDAALADGLRLLSEREYGAALTALEAAQALKPSDTLKIEIAKLRMRIDRQAAADRIIADIEKVLAQGDPAKAAELITAALQLYGGTDAAAKLTRLKLQADALVGAQLKNDDEKFARFKADAAAAAKDKNLRAEALALEQALQFGQDDQLKDRLAAVRASLQSYDDSRQQAAELRKDAARLEDALALLQTAARAWDTPQVRQEIDEVALALENRRDLLTVADFEVRGEVGFPAAGREVADNLLPLFKKRYDLVERGQLAKVVEELKLQAGQLGDDAAQQKAVGRLTKARYLVLGSVSPLGGVTIDARLVDVKTGLVVQTGKLVAATPEAALLALPDLADQLLMSDADRIALETKRAQQPQKDFNPPLPVDAPLPPLPPRQVQQPPPPILVNVNRPPTLVGLQPGNFQQLVLPPAGQPLPTIVPGGQQEVLVQQRLLVIALQMGDNLFLRGRYAEARPHYEFALRLAPTNLDVRLRMDRLLPLLPPAPTVVIDVPPPRPRVAFLPFVVSGNPATTPPGLSLWTPWQLAPYFSPPMEVVDPDVLYWYMGRAGISVGDLLTNPYARRWLGRALNIQYFVLGDVREAAGIHVTTYLVDAEYGFLRGTGRLNVRNPDELKWRLFELARLTLMSPEERLAYQNQAQQYNALLAQAGQQRQGGNFLLALELYRDALKLRPGNVELLYFIERDGNLAHREAWRKARRQEYERQQVEAIAFQQQQLDLAQQTRAAQLKTVPEKQRQQAQNLAYQQLLDQARRALTVKNYPLSVKSFEAALALRKDDGVSRELAKARQAAGQQADADRSLRLAAELKARDAQLTAARAQLEQERQRRLGVEKARLAQQQKQADLVYQSNFAEGQRLLKSQKYDAAIAALQAAKQAKKTAAVEALLTQAVAGQAKTKDPAAYEKLQQQLAQEKARRDAAEADAKLKQQAAAAKKLETYNALLKQGQAALAAKKYAEALKLFQDAKQLSPDNPAVAPLLAQAARGVEDDRTAQDLAQKQKAAAAKKLNDFNALIQSGQKAMTAKRYADAVQSFSAAKQLLPTNPTVGPLLAQAQKAVNDERLARDLAQKQKAAEAKKLADFTSLMKQGKSALGVKKYADAVNLFGAALKLYPNSTQAQQSYRDAQRALAAQPNPQVLAAFNRKMQDALTLERQQRWADAIKAYQDALKFVPTDAVAKERIRVVGYTLHMQEGQRHLAARRFIEAQRDFEAALALEPNSVPARTGLQKARNKMQ